MDLSNFTVDQLRQAVLEREQTPNNCRIVQSSSFLQQLTALEIEGIKNAHSISTVPSKLKEKLLDCAISKLVANQR